MNGIKNLLRIQTYYLNLSWLFHCHMRMKGEKNTLRYRREWDFVGSGPVLPATPPDAGTPWEGIGPSQADDGEEGGGAHQKSGEENQNAELMKVTAGVAEP